MTKRRRRAKKEKEEGLLQVAAILCIVVGIAQLTTQYTGALDLIGGYATGIICLAAGVTLFAFDKAPDDTLRILKTFLSFVRRIFEILVDFVKSLLSKE